jgi:glycosyltransferase involved in cell wall biosynthesis
MKFLIHANAPTVRTGYGVQCGLLAEQLRDAGHDVAISSTYGVQGSMQSWRGIRIYPCGYDVNSNDLLHVHADHWFDGQPGWIIPLIDVWAMISPRLADYNVAAWAPVDHFPVPHGVLDFFSRSQAVPVAMSRFGERLLFDAGLDPAYIPLSVDTTVYKPTPTLTADGNEIPVRQLFGLPDDAFVVGMVAMNKGWAKDRKGFNEAFWAFGMFAKEHDDAYLYMHSEKWGGAEGQNLVDLAIQAGIDDHRLIWAGGPNQYAYRVGMTGEMMAATYSAIDVLLAPSHGEGFCLPLIEAQACGTPVITTNFSTGPELVGNGWTVHGQPEHDPAHHANYVCPNIFEIVERLEDAYKADRTAMAEPCVAFAAQYDTRKVFADYWVPFIASLEAPAEKLSVTREPMPDTDAVAVICPIYKRTEHIAPLIASFEATTQPGEAALWFVCDAADADVQSAISDLTFGEDVRFVSEHEAMSCAERWNFGYRTTPQWPWVLLIGDDVRFHDGWLDHARKLSADYDVIGTNDTTGAPKNPKVANGSHADHFFVRRAYVEEHGACLDGPGVLAPDCYRHWYVDMEIIKLARARGIFTPCLDSVIEHLHPGYLGDEQARQADPTYMVAVESSEADAATFRGRLPLIEMARTSRGK